MKQQLIQTMISYTEVDLKSLQTMQLKEEIILTSGTGNETTTSVLYNRVEELDWIFPVLVNITLMIVHFWLLFSLIHYGIKNKMWRGTRNKSEALNTGLVYNSVVGCATACIFRLMMSLVYMNIGFSNVENEFCAQFGDAANASIVIVHFFVALFLWSRQRSFFCNDLLNINYGRPVKYFSSMIIVFIFGFGIFTVYLDCFFML